LVMATSNCWLASKLPRDEAVTAASWT
jgi:hypothetical protein